MPSTVVFLYPFVGRLWLSVLYEFLVGSWQALGLKSRCLGQATWIPYSKWNSLVWIHKLDSARPTDGLHQNVMCIILVRNDSYWFILIHTDSYWANCVYSCRGKTINHVGSRGYHSDFLDFGCIMTAGIYKYYSEKALSQGQSSFLAAGVRACKVTPAFARW